MTISQRRSGLQELLGFAGLPVTVAAIEERVMPGPGGPLKLRVYTPTDAGTAATCAGLIYFHGGGLVAGSLDSHERICCALSEATRCRVVAVDYRLGPEHRFPSAVEDACAAVEWIATHAADLGLDADRLGVGGDSAGAILAAVACRAAAAAGSPRLKLQLLLCPIMDYGAETESRRRFASGYLLDGATLSHDLEYYLREHDTIADPRISPLRAEDLRGLPPASIHTAEFDPVRDEGEAYARRLEAVGVRTRYTCHSGMIHLFYGMGLVIPYARNAYELIGSDVRAALETQVSN